MPSFCCVPECNQKGYKDEKNEKISYFNFPTDKTRRKQWLHAIRRDEGKDFRVTEKTKVCSRHFRSSDLKKSLNGRVYVKDNVVPSRFKWCPESPRKRKAPAIRFPLQATTKTTTTKSSTSDVTCSSLDSVNESETVQKASADELEQDAEDAMIEKLEEKMLSEDLKQKLLSRERKILEAENRIIELENENTLLREKLTAAEKKLECMTKRVFDIERFKCDEKISFYTGFPKYDTFVATYEFLNPGVEGENIRYCSSSERGIPDAFYDQMEEDDLETEHRNDKQGRRRKLKPVEEFFMVMCRLRRGFALQHLSDLFGVATSTVSRIFTAWVNFMYLKFAQINIWPSREVITKTMPEVFKDKYPSTRVIIDCTEIKCEMPSSLLLNTELFSSYKNHTTLKGLIGIAPNGAVTFISQLYTGSISDREIVIRSGFLAQEFSEGDSVMADKGFTIQDLLPLGTSLNIPPFLGQLEQMSAENVIRTQQIASVRIHVERAINRIKNYKIWNGVIPLSLFGLVNQMWSICSFLSNLQDPLIST